MRKIIWFILALVGYIGNAQTIDTILFEYDSAGNQIKRYTININSQRFSNLPLKDVENLSDEDLIKSDIYADVLYYPNPVKEELYVKWENIESTYVDYIAVYSLNGQHINTVSNLKGSNLATVYFGSLPQGIYTVVLFYSDSVQKSLKVIKN